MKFVKLFLIAGLLLALFSCSKHDDTAPAGSLIAGDWKVTSMTYTGTSVTNLDGESTSASFDGVGRDLNLSIHFKENPNTYTAEGDYTIDLTMKLLGESFDIPFTLNGFMGNGTWSLNGTSLKITNQTGSTESATISKMTKNSLTILWSVTETQQEESIPVHLNVKGTYVFEKE